MNHVNPNIEGYNKIIKLPHEGVKRSPKHFERGKRFTRLTLEEFVGRDKKGEALVLVNCDCGKRKIVSLYDLVERVLKSCGCLGDELRNALVAKSQTPESIAHRQLRNIWVHIKYRCYQKSNKCYHRYGGRGIVVCDRWKSSSANFCADMGPRPSPQHSVERIDVNGPYSPENCIWATNAEQQKNRRDNKYVVIDGVKMTQQDAGTLLGFCVPKKIHTYIRPFRLAGVNEITIKGKVVTLIPSDYVSPRCHRPQNREILVQGLSVASSP